MQERVKTTNGLKNRRLKYLSLHAARQVQVQLFTQDIVHVT
jgi:hypothetical protein